MENLISIIFSSSVIVALIGFVQGVQTNRLRRITDKRAEWREKLRDLGVNISMSDESNELELLSKLKLNINTKGSILRYNNLGPTEDESKYFLYDAYIWEIIDKIEKASTKEEKFFLKQKLVDAISLLLKHDWDRSKNEITSSQVQKSNNLTYILFALLGILLIWYIYQQEITTNLYLGLYWVLFVVLPIALSIFALFINIIHKKHLNKKNKEKTGLSKIVDINNTCNMLIGLTVMIVIICLSIYFSPLRDQKIYIFVSLGILSSLIFISNHISLQAFQDTNIQSYFIVAKNIIESIGEYNMIRTEEKNID